MGNKNGYFKLIRNENGMGIKIFPPGPDGEAVQYNEVAKYLESNNILNIDIKELNRAIMKAAENVQQILLTPKKGYPVNEKMYIIFDDNNMKATARFYPSSNDGKDISKDEILSELEYLGIKYGISENEIDRFLNAKEYCTDYIVAVGTPPRHGEDAKIKYNFNTDRRSKPRRNEDGSVDFHQLDNISHIHKGDLLAELIPADLGEPGTDVCGNSVQPRKVDRKSLKHGKNITLSEDGRKMFSEVDGHAMLENDKVFVSNVYEVPADVDNSTGDISYEGSVTVKGNVRTGFKIKASGDVEVYGAVEGAEIVSGGQIILHHGIQGMSKGILVAKGNIVAKFIESAKVHAQGYIEADTIIQSQVAAKGDITVMGVKGNIIGGYVRSTSLISAKSIGSPMGITTTVEVGIDPNIQERINVLKESMEEKNSTYKKMSQIVDMFKKKLQLGQLDNDKVALYKKSLEDMSAIQHEMADMQKEYDSLTAELTGNTNASIAVSQDIFPGTKVVIGGEIRFINEELCHCRFRKQSGDVRSLPL